MRYINPRPLPSIALRIIISTIHTVSQKNATQFSGITLVNVDHFLKFFHSYIQPSAVEIHHQI